MTVLALEIGPAGFAATRVADDVGADEIRRAPIPATGAWDVCRTLLLDAAAGEGVTAVGIASTGPIDMTAGVVAPAAVAEWQTGFELVESISKAFPDASVQLGLDGVCLALAEQNFGATAGVMDAMSVTVSDRITAGVMVGGLVVVGRTGNAGHLGHMLVPGFDELCECGGTGCVEAVAGGAAALRWARARGWAGTSVADLVAAARSGDDTATAAFDRAGTALGRAIASVAPLLDIGLVVVGGSMAEAGPAFWTPLNRAVATHARAGFLTALRVVPSELEDFGSLAGAGVLALIAAQQ
ncbi:ROK family protein [Nocardia vermiculata]|uniref:ROK family protein n=1 Tax=Nocardia vermiculata TaxID=257274 RepID=A0A846Y6N0_9NOCA|nr:ROK family protein [Nocardia vermiculata]NKY54005.1 ROK family protein [Nocardia vermiculata]